MEHRSRPSPASWFRASLRLTATLLLLGFFLFAPAQPTEAQGESGLVTATIVLNYGEKEMPVPMVLQFDAAGGPVQGQYELEWDADGSGYTDFYFLFFFIGTFSGFPEGHLEGTVEGTVLAPTLAAFVMAFDDSLSIEDCFQDLTGTWEGTISADGSGGGSWSIIAAANPTGNISAWESPTDDPWRLESLDMSAVAVVPPAVIPPGEELPAEVPGDPGVEPGNEGLPESSELPAGQVGVMAGTAVAGTVLGLGLSQLIPTWRAVRMPPASGL